MPSQEDDPTLTSDGQHFLSMELIDGEDPALVRRGSAHRLRLCAVAPGARAGN